MIAKHIPMTTAKKSDFAGLVGYLTSAQGKDERVGLVRMTNCTAEELDTAILEILSVQSQNTRSRADKTYHLILSFREGEAPDETTLQALEERVCDGLGFSGHQRVSVIHHDTENLHVHIAINKVHPTRFTIHEPFRAFHNLAQLCDKLEDEFGLEKDNHKASKTASSSHADDMERHAAVESLTGWIRRECAEQIQHAQSWVEMHQVMQAHRLQLSARGNGLVITSENGICVKASSVSRNFSKTKLEERLGAFKAPIINIHNAATDSHYEKRPTRSAINTVELYARYCTAQQSVGSTRADAWKKAVKRKKQLIEDAKRTGRLKRAALKLIRAPRIEKKLLYAAISKALCADIAAINQRYMNERRAIYERHKKQAWADWLRWEASEGNTEALAVLRARQASANTKGNTLAGERQNTATTASIPFDSITKKGTIIYRLGASAVRDDGDKFRVSRGADLEGLEAALRMAIGRYGSTITVNGSASFKERIAVAAAIGGFAVVFSDEALDCRRRQLAQAMNAKESKHGNSRSGGSRTARGSAHRGDYGFGREAAAARAAAAGGHSATAQSRQRAHGIQPNAGSTRKQPPSQASDSLRAVQEFGVVHVSNRGEVLLPGHVPGHLEHQGPEPDHGMRRHLRRSGRELGDTASTGRPNIGRTGSAPPPASKDRLRHLSQLGTINIGRAGGDDFQAGATGGTANSNKPTQPDAAQHRVNGFAAADKYIAELDAKRARGFDIPKHSRFQPSNSTTAHYAGTRHVDGQPLALLRMNAEIVVLPVDDATAQRLSRLKLGQPVALAENGTIRTKGRTR